MKEVTFLRSNERKWKRFESLIQRAQETDPDELARVFIELNDDLAYARTFYPESRTEQYLNELTGRIYRVIYRNKRERKSRVLEFWSRELPALISDSFPAMGTALGIFLLAVGIGVISQAYDSSFANIILGPAYVNQTIENIRSGDPAAIYKGGEKAVSFLGITINNVRVAFIAFAFGILATLGTAYILLTNGIMLGTFLYFFHQYDVTWEAWSIIWLHGTFEISSIVIGGGAGILLGKGWLFPGTYPRMTSLKRNGRKGVKIVFGTLPFFLAAGFIEAYVSRYTGMPDPLRVLIIGGSLAIVAWYFLYVPARIHSEQGFLKKSHHER